MHDMIVPHPKTDMTLENGNKQHASRYKSNCISDYGARRSINALHSSLHNLVAYATLCFKIPSAGLSLCDHKDDITCMHFMGVNNLQASAEAFKATRAPSEWPTNTTRLQPHNLQRLITSVAWNARLYGLSLGELLAKLVGIGRVVKPIEDSLLGLSIQSVPFSSFLQILPLARKCVCDSMLNHGLVNLHPLGLTGSSKDSAGWNMKVTDIGEGVMTGQQILVSRT